MLVADYLWRCWSAEEIVRHYPFLKNRVHDTPFHTQRRPLHCQTNGKETYKPYRCVDEKVLPQRTPSPNLQDASRYRSCKRANSQTLNQSRAKQ
jgi:hypothetical protein